ncbi:MAG: LPS export ABC transporter periplasmic protein LptC [Thermodesulfobacteriota bacterium]
MEPQSLTTGPMYRKHSECFFRADPASAMSGEGERYHMANLTGGMRHKELERWYRLRNIQKAAQFLVLIIVVVLVASFVSSRIFPLEERESFVPPPQISAGSRVENFSFSVPGPHPWQLRASAATVSDDMNTVVLSDPTVVYQGGKGGIIELSAQSGELDRESQNVRAKGNVVIRYRDMILATGELTYSQATEQAQTDSAVTMEGGDMRLTGRGLRISIPDEEINIEQDVKAHLFNVKWVDEQGKLPM